jgi:hypothetical protein
VAPRIVYLSWPAREISGGVKVIYQHVGLLREAGFEAVVATADGAPPPWFDTAAPTVTLDEVQTTDVLVFPENSEELFTRFATSAQPKVVFCQNPFQVWRGMGGKGCYSDWGVSHVLCVSQSVLRFCRRRVPRLPLAYTPFYIDHERFGMPAAKQLKVACVPRKRPGEAMAIRDLLHAAYPAERDVPWTILSGASEAQVAQVMAESAVFLSLARLEALGMTALEAMASGCLVAGFHGSPGGSDAAAAGNGLWAPEDDVVACTAQLAEALALVREQGTACNIMVGRGRQAAHAFRREEASRLLLETWHGLLPRLAR